LTTAVQLKSMMIGAYDAAVAACDPRQAVSQSISIDDEGVTLAGTRFEGARPNDIVLVALGKAASAMACGAAESLRGPRGIAASNHVEPCPVPLRIGSHPLPTPQSLAVGEALLDFVRNLKATDIVLYLISGGGSSIAAAPIQGLTISDLTSLNEVLLRSGMSIGEMNEIRAAVSRIKGGRLAAASAAGQSMTLVMSDVVGVGASHVASGPSLGAGMGAHAEAISRRYGLKSLVTQAVADALTSVTCAAATGAQPYKVIGSPTVAAHAAARYVGERGLEPSIVSTAMSGEARTVAIDMVNAATPSTISIGAGETTVSVAGTGRGGRNQEAALAAAIEISGTSTVFAALGTDGIDGATPAAGAVVDGATAAAARARGVDLGSALENNDSYTALSALDALVIRGHTGTNVADLWIAAKATEA
jgi:glycerate 2-kinase